MPTIKRLLKNPTLHAALSFLLSLYIRLVFLTSRKSYHIASEAAPYMRGEQNAIFAFWHGRMMMLPMLTPARAMHVLISRHRDGRLISQTIKNLDHHTVAGSSSKGGSEAVRAIVRILRKGENVSITPDGPRGPSGHAQGGIVTIAKLSGKPVIPATFYASRHVRLKSWDRFMIALPFSRIVFCVGAPITVADADEAARLAIEQAMNELVKKADAL